MAKQTLLDLTQRILNDMNGDEVNSISDTIESQQVAQVIRDTYDEIISSRTWPHLNQLMALTPQGSSRPTHVDTNATWTFIKIIKYNVRDADATRDNFVDLDYMTPEEFLNHVNARNSSLSTTTEVTDPTGITFQVINDSRPYYWTSFNDETIVFDSYDTGVDTNLQESKFQCWGNVEPAWSHVDGFTPDLPAKAFPYLLAEAKSVAFNALMQVGNQKAEQQSRRQRVWLSREKWRTGPGMQFPDYGRKSSK